MRVWIDLATTIIILMRRRACQRDESPPHVIQYSKVQLWQCFCSSSSCLFQIILSIDIFSLLSRRFSFCVCVCVSRCFFSLSTVTRENLGRERERDKLGEQRGTIDVIVIAYIIDPIDEQYFGVFSWPHPLTIHVYHWHLLPHLLSNILKCALRINRRWRRHHHQQHRTTSPGRSFRLKSQHSLTINEYELRRMPTQQRRVVKKTLMANVGYRLAKRKQLHIQR